MTWIKQKLLALLENLWLKTPAGRRFIEMEKTVESIVEKQVDEDLAEYNERRKR